MNELKRQEAEILDIMESLLDVADIKCTGPPYVDDPPAENKADLVLLEN